MADKQISELTAASNLTDSTLFVVEQGGSAKKANWSLMKNYISQGTGILAVYLPSNSDADTLDSNMTFYSFGSSNMPAHIPSNVRVGHIINGIGGTEQRRIQMLFDSEHGVMYYRIKISGNWGGWQKIATESDISGFNNQINAISNSLFKTKLPLNRLYYDDGHYVNHTQYDCSDLIPVTIPVTVKMDVNIPSGFHALLYYDSSYNVIGSDVTNVASTGIERTITNTNIAYIRFQGRNLNFSGNTIEPVINVYYSVNDKITDISNQLSSAEKITLTKTSSSAFNIKVPCRSGKVVRYDYSHDVKVWDSLEYTDSQGDTKTATNVKSADYWNNYYVYNDTTGDYVAQGHSNFIINKNDHFSGDGHGNEVNITFVILADGMEVDISTLAVGAIVSCGDLRIIAKTRMFRVGGNNGSDIPSSAYPALDTSGKPIVDFIHCMEIDYHIGNVVEMHNKLIVQNDNTVFNNCFGAMLECQFGDFDTVIVNNGENTQNNISSNGTVTVPDGSTINLRTTSSVYGNVVEMFGVDQYIRQSLKNDDPLQRAKQAVSFAFYENRLKCYFAPIVSQSRYPAGQTPDVFNAGDVISVTNERVIAI